VTKVKGLFVNHEVGQWLHGKNMEKLIRGEVKEFVDVDEHKIIRDRKSKKLVSVYQEKVYRFCYDKGVIKGNFETIPYGFCF